MLCLEVTVTLAGVSVIDYLASVEKGVVPDTPDVYAQRGIKIGGNVVGMTQVLRRECQDGGPF